MQYVDDFKLWVLAAGNAHWLPKKEILKMFVSGLKPVVVFREEIYSRAFETLVDVMAETRHELANYRDIIKTILRNIKNKIYGRLPKNLEVTKFAAGDHVLLTYPNRPPNKLAGMYGGSMAITSIDCPDLIKVRDLITNKESMVHANRIRPFKHQEHVQGKDRHFGGNRFGRVLF